MGKERATTIIERIAKSLEKDRNDGLIQTKHDYSNDLYQALKELEEEK